jgi:hypothetical protein
VTTFFYVDQWQPRSPSKSQIWRTWSFSLQQFREVEIPSNVGSLVMLRVRCCPVSRLAKDAYGMRAGAELDIAELAKLKGEHSGHEIYTAWLGSQLERAGVSLGVSAQERSIVTTVRRTQPDESGRRPTSITRPCVDFRAEVRIKDPVKWEHALKFREKHFDRIARAFEMRLTGQTHTLARIAVALEDIAQNLEQAAKGLGYGKIRP